MEQTNLLESSENKQSKMLAISRGVVSAPFLKDYNLLSSDFTLSVMVKPKSKGTIISTCSFYLNIDSKGEIELMVFKSESSQCIDTVSEPTNILNNNQCHTITCISPVSGEPSIFLNGRQLKVTQYPSGGGIVVYPDSNQPIVIGANEGNPPYNQYTGGIMNLGIWNRILPGDKFALAGYGYLESITGNLVGYWFLDGLFNDYSRNNNSLVPSVESSLSFTYCFSCVAFGGPSGYNNCLIEGFAQLGEVKNIEYNQSFIVNANTPFLTANITDNSGYARFPEGVFVSLTEPNQGKTYNSDINTKDVFVKTKPVAGHSTNSLFGLFINKPTVGNWTISIHAPSNINFTFSIQAFPNKNSLASAHQVAQGISGSQRRTFKTLTGWNTVYGIMSALAGIKLISLAPKTSYAAPVVALLGVAEVYAGIKLIEDDNQTIEEAAETIQNKELPKTTTFNRSCWLSQLSDNTSIGLINLPGTHDSASITDYRTVGNGIFSCQDRSIKDQLEGGIRVLDVRLEVKKEPNGSFNFITCHGPNPPIFPIVNEYQSFKSLLIECKQFLSTNDKESIVMSLKIDEPNDFKPSDYASSLINLLNDYPIYDKTISKLPKLGQLRGKIYLINRITKDDNDFGVPLDIEDDTTAQLAEIEKGKRDYPVYIQDKYNYYSPGDYKSSGVETDKWGHVESAFSQRPEKGVTINFASAFKIPRIDSKHPFGVYINNFILNWFGEHEVTSRPKNFGWIMMDYPFQQYETTHYGQIDIVEVIISSNFRFRNFSEEFQIIPYRSRRM